MIDRDTDIGGRADRFPATRRSAVRAIRSSDEDERRQAYEILVATYWKPVYKYLRLKWRESNEDAKDLTQGFFALALEKGYFLKYDPAKAAFRTYLRKCLDGFVSNQKKAARRLKRGGEAAILSLDFQEAEGEFRRYEIPDGVSMEDYFYGEWARSVFSIAIEDLRRDCESRGQETYFSLFHRYDLEERPEGKQTYAELANEFGIVVTDVTNYLASVRRRFRKLVLERLRELTIDDDEFKSEARSLLGIEAE